MTHFIAILMIAALGGLSVWGLWQLIIMALVGVVKEARALGTASSRYIGVVAAVLTILTFATAFFWRVFK